MIDSEKQEHYFGVYYGLVEDNKDPLQLGRLRIRTPLEADTAAVPTESLTWANYVSPSGGSKDAGYYFIPPVGAQVAVQFVGGHGGYPVWIGTVWGIPGGVPDTFVPRIEAVGESYGISTSEGWDYTKVQALTTPGGGKLVFDDNYIIDDQSQVSYVNHRSVQLSTPNGTKIRLVEDKLHTVRSDEVSFKSYLEVSTPDNRILVFDDQDETITITSTEGHKLEINSALDYLSLESELDYKLILDQRNERILLHTQGNNGQTGHELGMYNTAGKIILRTRERKYFFEADDNGSAGLYSGNASRAGVRITSDLYGADKDSVFIYANVERGANRNVIVVDRGSASTGSSIGFYDDFGAQTHRIRLQTTGTEAGRIDIGKVDGTATITINQGAASWKAGILTLESPTINLTSSSGVDLTIRRPSGLVSRYFSHIHKVDLTNILNLNNLFIIDPLTGINYVQQVTPLVSEIHEG